MTRPSCCLERTFFFLGWPAYYLNQPSKDKSLNTSLEEAKLMGKKPYKQEDMEKIILSGPECTPGPREVSGAKKTDLSSPS